MKQLQLSVDWQIPDWDAAMRGSFVPYDDEPFDARDAFFGVKRVGYVDVVANKNLLNKDNVMDL